MLLVLIRAIFILGAAAVGARFARVMSENELGNTYVVFIGIMLAAVAIVVGDLLSPRKRIQTISAPAWATASRSWCS